VPFRPSFECLWCGAAHTCRGPDDIEGWAQLCPDCVGKAGDNGFLRFRLRQAITERGRAEAVAVAPDAPQSGARAALPAVPDVGDDELVAYYEARAPEYDDWYEGTGRFAARVRPAWRELVDELARALAALPLGAVAGWVFVRMLLVEVRHRAAESYRAGW
jgi:hypothetical protein